MAHISRKELKKDEIRETLQHGAEAVISHQKLAGIILGIAAVVGLAILGWRFYTDRQTVKASAELDAAMKIFEARIRTAGEPVEPGEATYVEEKNKYTDAAKKFSEIAGKYARTRPGQIARFYTALCDEHLERYDDAQKELKALAATGTEEFASLARFQEAKIDEKTGKSNEAAKLYRQLAEKPTVFVPKPVAQHALADSLSKKNPEEARQIYNQIKKDSPDSAVADAAEQRLETLGPKT